jgi:hypothetical protein
MVKQGMVAAGVIVATMMTAAQTPQQQAEAEQVRARQRIAMMEAVLERAVGNGADNVLRQVKNVMPDQPMLAGAPQVRGFRLDGYGVFFDVEVPLLRLPIMWPLRYMVRDNRDTTRTLQQLQATMRRLEGSPEDRARLEVLMGQLEMELQGDPRARGRAVSAANLVGGGPAPEPPASPASAIADVVNDPEDAYTREVKAALVDAMIEHSLPLMLGPDEWLTVAARDNAPRDPLIPGDTVDFSTWIFRIKGSDLEAFRAGRMTIDEARKRVEQREY